MCGFLELLTSKSENINVIYPDEPKPIYEKWGRGRPSKEKLAKRKEYTDWQRKVKVLVKYEQRLLNN